MAGGIDNLTSFDQMDAEKQKKIASAGGKASVEARRKKKAMREQAELLLGLPLQSKKAIKVLDALGIEKEDMDNQMAMLVAMFQAAIEGDVKAFVALRDTAGDMPVMRQDVNVTESQKFADVLKQLGGEGLGENE